MKSYLAIGVGILALLGLFGVTIAEMQTSQEENNPHNGLVGNASQGEDSADAVEGNGNGEAAMVAEQGSAQHVLGDSDNAGTRRLIRSTNSHSDHTTPRRARGLYIRPDGMTVARVNYIDRNTLSLVPVANARISFIQHRLIVAQALTDERGVFAVSGLTPWGVYSVTAASMDWVCMFSAVIRPYDHHDDHPHRSLDPAPTQESPPVIGASFGRMNEIRFVSADLADDDNNSDEQLMPLLAAEDAAQNGKVPDTDGTVDDFLDYEFLEFQLMPREDLVAALRAGLFGTDVCGLPAGSVCDPCGGGSGGGGGGGGGGGVVGLPFGGGGGLGGALMGAGFGGGVGGEGGSSEASPSLPE